MQSSCVLVDHSEISQGPHSCQSGRLHPFWTTKLLLLGCMWPPFRRVGTSSFILFSVKTDILVPITSV